MAADRGVFIDQSQSFNVHMVNSNYGKLTSMHFYAWKKGLKTGMYYLRSQAAVDAIKFTVDQQALREDSPKKTENKSNGSQPTSRHSTPVRNRILQMNGKTPMNGKMNGKMNGDSPKKAQTMQRPTNIEEWRRQRKKQEEAMICSLENKDECVACGS